MGTAARQKKAPLSSRLLLRVLGSPISGLFDAALLRLSIRGRLTGRAIVFPVQYAAGDDAIWIWPAKHESKTWWRNLVTPTAVCVQLRGQPVDAVAQAVTAGTDPRDLERGRDAYCSRFPRAARRLATDSEDSVLVRIEVPAEVLERTREATTPAEHGLRASVRRHRLGAFLGLAFAFSWGYWIPVAVAGGHWSHFPGLTGPLLSAVAVTAIACGPCGLRDPMRRAIRWRVPIRWYAACALLLGVGVVAIGARAAVGADVPSLRQLSTMAGLPKVGWIGVFALTFLINGYGEEVGWRGYAWPALRDRHTLAGASLLLAIPWAIWHIPTFWIDSGMRGFPLFMVPGFFVGMARGRSYSDGSTSGLGPACSSLPYGTQLSTWSAPPGEPKDSSPRPSQPSSSSGQSESSVRSTDNKRLPSQPRCAVGALTGRTLERLLEA